MPWKETGRVRARGVPESSHATGRYFIFLFFLFFSIYIAIKLFKGIIIILSFSCDQDGTYNIEYDDGDKEYKMASSKIRLIKKAAPAKETVVAKKEVEVRK